MADQSTTRRGKGQPQPLSAKDLAQRASKDGGPHFHISHVIKSVDGDNVVDHSLADILARGHGREDQREPDTPVTSSQPKARPKQGFPSFQKGQGGGRPSGLDPGLIQFTSDSIITPHTYARFHTEPHSAPKQSSELGYKVFHYLRKNWQNAGQTFSHYGNARELRAFGQEILALCQEVSPIFEAEPMYMTLPANIFVIGDVHGNFADLHYFFSELVLFKDITLTPYSFLCLGDYVDRGQFSLECVLYCLSLKAQSPETFFMLRGNHEDPGINGDVDTYGNDCFQSQCRNVFGDELGMEIWHAVNGVFRMLPMAACIEGKIFCSHGGIPRYFGPPDQDDRLRLLLDPQFPRFRSLFEPLDLSVVSKELMERFWVLAFDLMWSDPSEGDSELNEYGFGRNDRGNCIITFGEVAVDRFLQTHHLELMFRAHQEKSDGLKLSKSAKCLTVFSSSNYQGHGNGAGVVFVSADGRVRLIMKEPSRD